MQSNEKDPTKLGPNAKHDDTLKDTPKSTMSSKKQWIVFAIMVLATIAVMMSRQKVNGNMLFIRQEWGLDVTTGGLLVSAVSLFSFLTSLPAGSIVQKIGSRKIFLFLLSLDVVVNIIGAISPDFMELLITRAFEGVGAGLMLVVVPTAITRIFPAEKRGLPMTLFSIRVPISTFCIYNLNNLINPAFGWRGVWWAAAAILSVMLLLNVLFFKLPEGTGPVKGADRWKNLSSKGSWTRIIKNGSAVSMMLFVFVLDLARETYGSYFPSYLVTTFNIPTAQANTIVSNSAIVVLIACLVYGYLLNKIPNKHHPKVLVVCMVVFAIGAILIYGMTSLDFVYVFVIFITVGFTCAMPTVHNIMADVVDPVTMPVGMAVIAFSSALGSILAPIIGGRVVDFTGGNWANLVYPMIVACAIGIVLSCAIVITARKKQIAENDKAE